MISHQRKDGASDSAILLDIWNAQCDDDKMSYRAAISGQVKSTVQKLQSAIDAKDGKGAGVTDELNQYEPQQEDAVPRNFLAIELLPFQVDHTVYAPPAVIADQRRKPQQYESIAQPFKKDRRFLHVLQGDVGQQEWLTTEINP